MITDEGRQMNNVLLCDSQAVLNEWKSGIRDKFLGQMKPLLAGPPVFEFEGSVTSDHSAAKPAAGQVLRMVGYKCLAGKETEWKALMTEVVDDATSGGIEGLVYSYVAYPDAQ